MQTQNTLITVARYLKIRDKTSQNNHHLETNKNNQICSYIE